MRMTPKAARRLGLMPPDAPKPTTTTTKHRPARGGYAGLSAAGWQFGTGPRGVFAFRCRRDGRIDRTARYEPGDGDSLGQHYRPAIEAIDRGEYTTEEST